MLHLHGEARMAGYPTTWRAGGVLLGALRHTCLGKGETSSHACIVEFVAYAWRDRSGLSAN
jgi:hypothetical protein